MQGWPGVPGATPHAVNGCEVLPRSILSTTTLSMAEDSMCVRFLALGGVYPVLLVEMMNEGHRVLDGGTFWV